MRKALIVWGGWSGHEPEQCAAIIRGMLEEDGFSVAVETKTDAFGDPSIRDLHLVVPIYTMSKIEKEHAVNLASAVEAGVGLAGHHGGMADAFRESTEYQFMVGGQWVAHPGDIIDYRVEIARPDDPVMEGISDFAYRSEQYYMHVDPSNEVLATTTFGGAHAHPSPRIQRHGGVGIGRGQQVSRPGRTGFAQRAEPGSGGGIGPGHRRLAVEHDHRHGQRVEPGRRLGRGLGGR